MKNFAIVVSGYNRVHSISRLLQSLKDAEYYNIEVPLIISIDYSGNDEVANFANNFDWPYGKKEVIQHEKQLGLRNHILYCGNLTNKYDAVVMLEDDIYVSPYFFQYVLQTVDMYKEDDRIAGISLYTHLWNQSARRPFIPMDNGYDIYFIQYAQSWGQVWTKGMWSSFYNWYTKNNEDFDQEIDIPNNVANWPSSSWLKYYIRYIVKTDRYFVYPYLSLSTNFTDLGTHNKISTTGYQVPLLTHEKTVYNLPKFKDTSICYDVFFERLDLGGNLGLTEDILCTDLYGLKNNSEGKRFWLTTSSANYKVKESFALQLRPPELNVINNIKGEEIFLYDTNELSNQSLDKNINYRKIKLIRYDIKSMHVTNLIRLLYFELNQYTKRKILSFFRKTK